ncbi:hypothetical protein GCM10007938_41970 [Vibrio zhanjiangensis]|uniref:50S ribosomal protein L33 n=1 Tax=Vibrio zhanjiangensis TaxID=1046128 RepID=A0ABQ6F4F2_9VIBR|nr:hypothetical protein [Vibrio zhanjiangensis]GLT20413.1 hypothetical protein GCM10007938_41970 [Vibrio zhanjiangensis]
MRVSTSRRRRWNNIMILGIIAFIVILNLPTVIKTYLIKDNLVAASGDYPYLLDPTSELRALYFSDWSLENQNGQWSMAKPGSVSASELAQRWSGLVGTAVDGQTFDSLKSQLGSPSTIEVWYHDQEEPQRITFYQTPQFWLLKNWQEQWIAISVAPEYLLP